MKVVITGTSRGLGFETALLLCRQGHDVFAVSRNREGLEQLQSATGGGGNSRLQACCADISSEKGIDKAIAEIGEVFNHVDVLINNAGAILKKPFDETSAEALRHVFDVNVFVPFFLAQKLLPLLSKSSRAHIVNIGSMGGVQGSIKFPGLAAYSSSKGALAVLSEVLAEELKAAGIRVNCLALGAAQTAMLNEVFPGYKAPLQSAEMAEWIAWFAINGHNYFNGKVLPVSSSTP